MKRNIKRLPALLLAVILCLSLLPVTALAANFPSMFYASVTYKYESNTKYEIFGTVTQSADTLTYSRTGEKMDRVVYGMEYAGGVFFTVEGNKLPRNEDDGLRELRMYNSDLSSYRTIGEVNQEGGGYWIVDTAMDLSGDELALYGTYQSGGFVEGAYVGDCPYICKIDLTSGKTSNWLQVTGLESEKNDIIYAIAFDKDGTLYAIGADKADDGGKASLYTIDLNAVQDGAYGVKTVQAHKIAAITSQTGNPIYTNFAQDLAFDHATSTLYWMENKSEVLYTLNTESAVATSVGSLPTLQSFCIPYDAAFAGNKHMVSVVYTGGGKVTNKSDSNDEGKAFYMVDKNGSLTLALTPDKNGKLLSVKVDDRNISVDNLMEYTFEDVTENHVIEVAFRENLPVTQQNMTWFHYQGRPASFYTQHHAYKFYELPNRIDPSLDDLPREGYTQTLLDENGDPIPDNTIIPAGNYDVRVTHDGTDKYNALNVVYEDALQLAKCPGTPGRPVVYGKVGCTQGDLTTISALQDYYGSDGELIDAAHDEIPVTLVWLNPETTYDTVGNVYASATIYAAQELDQRLKDCYNLDDGTTPLTEGCPISSRATQVVVLPADQASLIKLQASDASGGTVSGKGVYKNGDSVTVTAAVNENAGYTFGGWQEDGSVVSNDATYTFNASGDRTLTALFEVNENYRVILKTDPQDGGTVTGGGNYKEGSHEATVTATANQGHYFIGWYEGDTQKSTETSYTFTVPEAGATLTAKFGIDYLGLAELAKNNLESALGTPVFEWSTLTQAVDAYEKADEFVNGGELPTGVINAQTRFQALTGYYSGVEELDFSNLGLNNEDLTELYLFTGVTDLNLSGNRGVTDLTGLTSLTTLTTLDISNTGVTNLGSNQSVPQNLATLTAKNLSLTSISALAELVSAEGFNTDAITKWDFTGSTLPPKDQNRTNVATIQEKLGNKFIPPTVPDNTYIISASPATLDFGNAYPNYTQPAAQTVTITNTGNQTVTLAQPTSKHYILGDLSAKELKPNGTATFTVQPKSGLDVNTYNEDLTVTGSSGDKTVEATVQLQFEVKQQTGGGGGGGGGGGVATYTVTVGNAEHGKVTASPTRAGSGSTVTLTVKPDQGYALDTLTATDAKGNEVKLTDKGNGTYTFTMPASKVKIAASFKESAEQVTNPFTDVFGDAYYYDAVLWAAANGVTNGTSAAAFSPDAPVTRAQAVTFQWRAHGAPEAAGDSFDDVAADTWYTGAVTWAVANGITNGTGGNKFSPEAAVTRAQAVTFLYRELA